MFVLYIYDEWDNGYSFYGIFSTEGQAEIARQELVDLNYPQQEDNDEFFDGDRQNYFDTLKIKELEINKLYEDGI